MLRPFDRVWSGALSLGMAHAVAIVVAVVLLVSCAPPPEPRPTVIPSPLPTRQVISAPSPTAKVIPTPSATSVPPRTYTSASFDPYAGLYVPEREGFFVTSRIDRARYFYRWDDRRWYTILERVWFRNTEDLLTVFPDRIPAP